MARDASSGTPEGPAISVIVPTHNRSQILMECLRHLEAQELEDFEVIVVDDGSVDGTRAVVEEYRQRSRFPLVYVYQQQGGAGRARNVAAQQARAAVIVLIGDDILVAPEFLKVHLQHHRLHEELEAVAVGYTEWDREHQVVTPYMEWLEKDVTLQFAYRDLWQGESASWRHFYTSNLSMKAAYLRANPFHEGFRAYGMEDIELGYRLDQRAGLQMAFLPQAMAFHVHRTTFRDSCRRALRVGEAEFVFATLWPEFRQLPSRSFFKRGLLWMLTEPRMVLPLVTAAADLLLRVWWPNPLTMRVLTLHQRRGYRLASTDAAAGRS